MSNNTRESRAPVWDADTRRLAANIDDVIEIGAKNELLLHVTQTDEHKHFIQQMRYAPEDVTDEQLRGLGTYVYWHLKHDLELKWKDDQGQDSDPEPTPKKPVTRRQTRSTTKSVIEHALSPKNQLETIADNVEKLQEALGGVLKSRFNLLLEEWESAKPDSDGFKDGTTPAKRSGLSKPKKVRDNQTITSHHLRFAAFFYEVGPEILKKITKRSKKRGNTDGIDRIAKFMVEQFDKVATGMKSIFDALDDYDLDYKGAIAGSSYGVIIPCSLKSDPNEDNVVAVVKNFLTEVDVVKGEKVDQSITDINNEISLMHKVAHGEGSEFFIKPLDWNAGPIAPFLVMEPIHGGNLEDFIEDLAIEERLELLPHFAKTLAASVLTLHKKGTIHRDIKLENLMLREAGDVGSLVVADLGLGTKVKVDETGFPTERCGTFEFMAPESWLEDRIKTYKVDLFSCGMTLLHFLVGTEIFKDIANGRTRNKVTGAFFTREELEEELDHIIYVPPQMINLLDGLTKPDPNERLSTEEWLHHPALQDVPNPLEVAEDVPTSDASSLPQDNIEHLKENLEAANQRAADAEANAADLQAKYDDLLKRCNMDVMDLDTELAKMDLKTAATDGAAELEALRSTLEAKNTELQTQALVHAQTVADRDQTIADRDQTIANLRQQLQQFQVQVQKNGGGNISSMSDLDQQVNKQRNNVKIVSSVAMNSRPSLDFQSFVSAFDEKSSVTFTDTFFNKYDGDNSELGCLLAFTASFCVSWKNHQTSSKKSEKWLSATNFLDNYASAIAGSTDALKTGDFKKKYAEVTKVERECFEAAQAKNKGQRKSFDTLRKQKWCVKANAISRDIGAKLTEAKIDENKDFHTTFATIKSVVNLVFNKNEALGFHLVPESYLQSFSRQLAIMHITAGTDYESLEN